MAAEFYLTRMGLTFYQSTMPRIADALEKIAEALKPTLDMDELRHNIKTVIECQYSGPSDLDPVAVDKEIRLQAALTTLKKVIQ